MNRLHNINLAYGYIIKVSAAGFDDRSQSTSNSCDCYDVVNVRMFSFIIEVAYLLFSFSYINVEDHTGR